jgi:hypothetical protein
MPVLRQIQTNYANCEAGKPTLQLAKVLHVLATLGCDVSITPPAGDRMSGAVNRLVPIYRDAFAAPDASWTLRFRREFRGATVLDMSVARARQVSFRHIQH